MNRIFLQVMLLFYVSCRLLSQGYTRADSLRGTLNANRGWWDVIHYDLKIKVNIEKQSISGSNRVTFKKTGEGSIMQIDLQEPLQVDSAFFHGRKVKWTREFNAWMMEIPESPMQTDSITVFYSGKPRAARLAPWDGGISWRKDEKKRPWIGVSCQGLGASVWWPNKDHQSDEPDKGMRISVNVPDTLVNISNGNLVSAITQPDKTVTWTYAVKNPINNYDVTFNIGKYVILTDTFIGKNGPLKTEYAVLDYNENKAETYLKKDTRQMLSCFEHWLGPYPFYEDGYRLVETSYLGMEHQSAISYGNNFKNGYLGRDRSSTGIGLLWDFIIVHESGHEWFGNNITSKDIADMWIHEGFTTYAEALFIECTQDKDKAAEYIIGLRKNIIGKDPLIADYGVNSESGIDIYDKGANLVHMIRQVIDNDSVFRDILTGMNTRFAKTTVTTQQIEDYIISKSGKDLAPVFDQYLRSIAVPAFEYTLENGKLSYRWNNCNKNFNMPLRVFLDNGNTLWLQPGTEIKETDLPGNAKKIEADRNFYIQVKQGFK